MAFDAAYTDKLSKGSKYTSDALVSPVTCQFSMQWKGGTGNTFSIRSYYTKAKIVTVRNLSFYLIREGATEKVFNYFM